MARIVSFSVDGLAGRTEAYSKTLERDVNVFYGINGSGKTTLLKILHSALSNDLSILDGLPFKSAEVIVFLNRYRSTFKRTFAQPPEPKEMEEVPIGTSIGRPISALLGAHRERPKWTSDPEEPDGPGLTTFDLGYLPIARLYRGSGSSSLRRKTMSEKELDAGFADGIKQIWTRYSADISNDIAEAQATGLANILHLVLSGETTDPEGDAIPTADEAYDRVAAFLDRQSGFQNVLDSKEEFGRKYETRPQTKSIVRQIERVERTIEGITAPRARLAQLLESLYSGNKRIVFTDTEIFVEILPKRRIGLPALSSGEKQLFVISLEALRVGSSSLIIDEPELSMHVDWQKKLLGSVQLLNPHMQLIVATHSPEIMADLPDNKVFSL